MILGFDCSHLDDINWATLSPDFKFAYIKATEGLTLVDPTLKYRMGVDTPIIKGYYHYFIPGDDAKAQAEHFLAQGIDFGSGLPPCIDAEEPGITPAMVREFIQIVSQATARKCMLYSYPSFLMDNLGSETFDAYLWVADYAQQPDRFSWTLWQRSQYGTQQGGLTDGHLDINVYNGTIEQLKTL